MANNFTIEVKGLDKVQKIFKDLPKQVQKEINGEMVAVGQEWAGVSRQDAPTDRARLRGSISAKNSNLALELVAQNQMAAFQEFGTKSKFKAPSVLGSYPAQFKGATTGGNPILSLQGWVKRKGITFSSGKKKDRAAEIKSIAFLIFRKQQKVGMPAKPFLFSTRSGADRVTFFVNKLRKNIAEVLKDII